MRISWFNVYCIISPFLASCTCSFFRFVICNKVVIFHFVKCLKYLIVMCRHLERTIDPCLVGRSYLRALWRKQLMHGKGLLSFVLLVGYILSLVCIWYLVDFFSDWSPDDVFHWYFYHTEEEASMLRSFVDEPAFTDLHWVQFNFLSCWHSYI